MKPHHYLAQILSLVCLAALARQTEGAVSSGNVPARQMTTATATPDPTVTLVPLTNVWRYNQSGTDLGTGWTALDYPDSGWPAGRGVLAYENNTVITPLTGTMLRLTNAAGQRLVTYYFRTHFQFVGDPASVYLSFSNLVDDGAVVCLNGEELFRQNMPGGLITMTTLASAAATEGVFSNRIVFPTNLWPGDNVLAVEVHQSATNSSDVVFGLVLQAVPMASGPPLIRQQPRHQSVRPSAPASFQVVAAGQPPLFYQWRRNGAGLPNATNATFGLPAVAAGDLGAYSVVVSNTFGSLTSATAWLSFAELDLQVVSIAHPAFPAL